MSVVWYIPNLVGYIRIILTLIAVAFIFKYPPVGIFFGFISQLLDALDGTLARRLDQCSALGTILDYAVDRMFVACWMIVLTVIEPQFWFLFVLILSLDLVSHLFQLYASQQKGKNSHKDQDEHQGGLLKYYYRHPAFMFNVCLFHDLWILAIVINHFYPSHYALIAIGLLTPFMLFKGLIHILQLLSSSRLLIALHHLDFTPE